MSDVKISALPAASAANLTDLLAKVNDPSGSPATQKVTLEQLKTLLNGGVKVYDALLTQTGTDAPAATVRGENSIGTITWTRETDAGNFTATSAGLFTIDKTAIFVGDLFSLDDPATAVFAQVYPIDVNTIRLILFNGSSQEPHDYFRGSIVIKVYP